MAHDPADASRRREQGLAEFAARGVHLRRRDHLDAVALEAINALRTAGIDALLLKGAALAEALYGADLARSYYDVDLIVAPSNRVAAGQVLAMLGYTNLSAAQGVEDVAGVLHADTWSRLDPDIGNVMIDLHWRLDGCLAPPQAVWSTLRGAAEPMTLAGAKALRLARPALALHTALHLAQHGPDDPKAAGDLGLAARRWEQAVWHEAARLASQLGANDAFAAGLRLLPEATCIADDLGVFATERAAWEMAHRDDRPRGTHYLGAFADARTMRSRAGLLRRALLPSRAWICWEMRWASRSRGHLAAAYVLHLLRAPVWAARAFRFARSRPR